MNVRIAMPTDMCGNSNRWSVGGVITLVVAVCLVLTSCVHEHRSAPASSSPAPNSLTHHTAVAPPPPATTTAPESPAAGTGTPLAAGFGKLEGKLNATRGSEVSAGG